MSIINIFLFYSIVGNIFERIIMYFIDRTYVSGFMGTIFTPIYGIGVLIIIFIHKKLNIKNKFLKLLIEFIIYAIILSIIEYIGGVLIENIFNKIFWNYDHYKYNIGLYTSFETALIWGIVSLVVVYLINPFFMKLEKHIPKLVTIVLSIIFIINLIFVIIVK